MWDYVGLFMWDYWDHANSTWAVSQIILYLWWRGTVSTVDSDRMARWWATFPWSESQWRGSMFSNITGVGCKIILRLGPFCCENKNSPWIRGNLGYMSKARSEMGAYQLNIDDSHRCFGKKVEDGDVEKALAKAAKKLVKVAHLDACFSKPSFKELGWFSVGFVAWRTQKQWLKWLKWILAWIGWNSLFCFVLQEKGAEGPVKELHIKVPFQKEMVDVKPRTMRFRTRTVASYASDREGLPDTPTGISIARFFFAFVQKSNPHPVEMGKKDGMTSLPCMCLVSGYDWSYRRRGPSDGFQDNCLTTLLLCRKQWIAMDLSDVVALLDFCWLVTCHKSGGEIHSVACHRNSGKSHWSKDWGLDEDWGSGKQKQMRVKKKHLCLMNFNLF